MVSFWACSRGIGIVAFGVRDLSSFDSFTRSLAVYFSFLLLLTLTFAFSYSFLFTAPEPTFLRTPRLVAPALYKSAPPRFFQHPLVPALLNRSADVQHFSSVVVTVCPLYSFFGEGGKAQD